MIWIRLALKEFVGNRRFCLFFVLNLSIGLIGFIALCTFGDSLKRYLSLHLKEMLTGDLMVTSSRPFTREENLVLRNVLGQAGQMSLMVSFYTMTSGPGRSRLTRIRAVDSAYPLYGKLGLSRAEKNDMHREAKEKERVYMGKDLARFLGVEIDGELTIGSRIFYLADHVTDDPGQVGFGFDMAPGIYMGLEQLDSTGLVRFGSRVRHTVFCRIPEGADIASVTRSLKSSFEKLHRGESHISVRNRLDVNRRLGRLFRYVTGYMGLVGLVAFFLAGIGAAYLFRGYIRGKIREIAILMGLGATRRQIFFLYFFLAAFLGFLAALVSVFFSLFLLPAFPLILKGVVPEDLVVSPGRISFLWAMGLGIWGSFIFCIPVWGRFHNLKPATLFRGDANDAPASGMKKMRLFMLYLPALSTFWLISMVQTGSPERGTVFFAGFMAVLFIMLCLSRALFLLFDFLSGLRSMFFRMVFRNLYRNRRSSISCFLAISLGAFLINLIPQIEKGLSREIETPGRKAVPGFFLMDIQSEQISDLEDLLGGLGVILNHVSPLVRGRIKTVNGESFSERMDRRSDAGRRRRREYNFSYRKKLGVSESLVKGRALSTSTWSFESGKPFEVSLEEGFARRTGMNIGDTIGFDVYGMRLSGRVTNFRKVKWNSFQPNFFILFQNGVLNDAPASFLASVPPMDTVSGESFQRMLSRKFPNISVVDVGAVVNKILTISSRLGFAVQFLAILAVISGLTVVYSIARYELRDRLWEINLMKVLGAGISEIRGMILMEYAVLGFSATAVAAVLSVAASYGISYLFFDSIWALRVDTYLLSMFSIPAICVFTSWIASTRALGKKPVSLLRRQL